MPISRGFPTPRSPDGAVINTITSHEFRSCEVLWEETPRLARYSRHPLPKGEGRNQPTLTALSRGERVDRSRRSHQPVREG